MASEICSMTVVRMIYARSNPARLRVSVHSNGLAVFDFEQNERSREHAKTRVRYWFVFRSAAAHDFGPCFLTIERTQRTMQFAGQWFWNNSSHDPESLNPGSLLVEPVEALVHFPLCACQVRQEFQFCLTLMAIPYVFLRIAFCSLCYWRLLSQYDWEIPATQWWTPVFIPVPCRVRSVLSI